MAIHGLLLMANIVIIIMIITNLFASQSGAAAAQAALKEYIGASSDAQQELFTADSSFSSPEPVLMPSPRRSSPPTRMPVLAGSFSEASLPRTPSQAKFYELHADAEPAFASDDEDQLASSSTGYSAAASPHSLQVVPSLLFQDAIFARSKAKSAKSMASVNPLKLLIFHTQQMSIPLVTSTSMPSILAASISIFSAVGNGFSAPPGIECLLNTWSLEWRCWTALAAPAFLLAVAGLNWWRSLRRAEADLVAYDPLAAATKTDASISRVYSVITSLLYLLLFPCASTALTSLGCTDNREVTGGDPNFPSKVYLNLAPWQACDSDWASGIFAPALMAALFWCVIFPIGSTVQVIRWARRLQPPPGFTDGSVTTRQMHTWFLVSDLIDAYLPRWYWWEQVLMVERLLIAAALAIIPSTSMYLPLCLLAILQFAIIAQHYAHPYKQGWLNFGELCSLYLLLLNYATGEKLCPRRVCVLCSG
jgi:hypothetical protein